ncbi:MAG TPA: hypothetical protein VGS41_02270 [Chthonomonadales bacterium]|nr:hypothetical protein [Chthonomonadales bacterium]
MIAGFPGRPSLVVLVVGVATAAHPDCHARVAASFYPVPYRLVGKLQEAPIYEGSAGNGPGQGPMKAGEAILTGGAAVRILTAEDARRL